MQAGDLSVTGRAFRIYHTQDATQRMAPGSNQASDGNTLWLWEQESGAPYNCEMFWFEATGEDDGSVYWYCKQNDQLVMQAEASSVKMTAKDTSSASQKWVLEKVEGKQDQYYLKNGSRYAVTAGSRHAAVTMSDTPQAWTLAPVTPSMTLKSASIKTGETVPVGIDGYDENGDAWSEATLSKVQLTTSDDTVVGVEGMYLTGKAPGTATVTAAFGEFRSQAEIKVLAFTRSKEWGGVYRIDSGLFPNYLIEAGSDWIGEGAELYLWNTGTKPERLWIFSESGDGYLYWHPMNNIELAIQPAGDGSAGQSVRLAKWEPGNEAQMWEIVPVEGGTSYQLKNKASGKFVGTNENKNTQLIKMHEQSASSAYWELNDQMALDVSLELGVKFLQLGKSVDATVLVADKLGNTSDAKIVYTCSKEGIVKIDGNTITGLAAGTVNITASASVDGKTYTSNTVHLNVTEEEPVFTGNEWYKDITTAEVNREPSHADVIPYQDAATAVASEKSALDEIGEEKSAYYQLLTQTTWDFALVRTPAEADAADAKGYLEEQLPEDAKADFQKEFVPQTWQTYRKEDGTFKYFDEPIYTNSIYPWGYVGNSIEYDDPQAPLYYNPVGYYRTEFETPENWDGREIFISLQAVKSAYYLYINGRQAGYSTDSHSAHDFNITPYLHNKGEKNTLALKVYRWSVGSYLENQDYIQQSGIIRDVYLYSKDKKAEIRDFFVQTKFKDRTDKNSDVTMSVDVDVRNLTEQAVADTYTADVKLLDMDGKTVGQDTLTYDGLKALNGKSGASNPDAEAADSEKKVNLGDRKTAVIEVKNPKKWFPDTPNLYMVTIELKDPTGKVIEAAADHVGFREIYKVNINEAEQEQMQITGQKLIFRGVNRHDMNLETGNAVKRQDIIDDLKMMKQYNVNAVRTSHYPNDKLLYDVADELGIYVYAEANVESHYGAYGDHKTPIPGADKRWVTPVMDRNMNMLELLKNHASIIGWSFANEATYTRIELNNDYCFWAASMAVLHRDPGRLRMYERESDGYYHRYQKAAGADPWGMETREKNVVDVHSTQYPEAKNVEAYAKNTNNKMPYFEQEYEHAMGQSFGSFDAFWDLNRTYGNLQGGFIWDWSDQAILTKRAGRDAFWGYGGDWIGGAGADAFCGNGVFYADHTPSPKAVQMRYDHQQVNFYLEKEDASVADGEVKVRIVNEYENTDLSAFNIEWVLKKDNVKIKDGTLALSTKAMAGQDFGTETVTIALPETEAKAGDVYLLEFSVKNKVKPDWDARQVPYDNVVAHEQFDLTPETGEKTLLNYNAMEAFAKADETDAALTVEGKTADGRAYSLEVDKKTGILKNYTVDGRIVLEKGPVPSFWRAQNYNDTPVKYDSKLRNETDTMELAGTPVVTKDENGKHIRVELKVKLPVDADQTLVYDIYGNGEIVVGSTFAPKSNFAPGNRSGNGYALPKVGLRMTVDKAYENVEYFGRGPADTYIDRKEASDIGVYKSTVTEQFDRKQLTAQENGNHTDIRWIALTDANGDGIMVTADGTMESSALHVKAEKVNPSTYEVPYNGNRIRHSTEVPMDEQTYLCLDTMQRGVSNTAFFNHVPLEGFYPHTRPDADGNYPVYEKTVCITPVTAATDKIAAGKLGFAAENGAIILPDDVEGLKEEIRRLMTELNQFAEDMADLKEKAEQIVSLETRIAELSKQTEKIAQLESRIEKIAELETELSALKDNAAKAEDLKEQEAKIIGLETELSALKAETAKIEALKQQTDKIAGLEEQLKTLKTETDKLPSIQEQTDKIAGLENQLKTVAAKADKIDGYEADIKKIADMQKDLTDLKTEAEKLSAYEADMKKIAGLETAVNDLKAKSEKVDALDTEVKKISGMQNEISQLRTQVERLVSLEAEVNRLKAETERVAALEAETKKIAQMQAQIAELEKARAEAEANMKKVLEELAKAQSADVLQKGDTVTAGGVKYRVTDPDKKLAEAYAPESKSARIVTVAATVTVKGVKLSVTAIADKAFKGMGKLTKVTIGKNMKKIGKEAFAGDKELSRITVKSKKLKKLGSGVCRGIAGKAVVKVPKGKKSAYKKLFLGEGQNPSVKVK